MMKAEEFGNLCRSSNVKVSGVSMAGANRVSIDFVVMSLETF